MKKIYSSYSIPHFSVGEQRVAFSPTSGKESFFITSDEKLQEKIEKHPWYNDKFFLKSTVNDKPAKAAEPKAAELKVQSKEMRDMHFSTLADAKNFLSENFDVTRTSIRSTDAAVEAGKANGVNIIFDK